MKNKLTVYGLISIFSFMIRNYVLPNPFDCFGEIYAFWISLFAEPFLHGITFELVGFFYQKGSAPFLGSLLYLFFYCCLNGILQFFGLFRFNFWLIMLIIALITLIIFGTNKLIEYLKSKKKRLGADGKS